MMDREGMISLVRAMFRKEKAIWRCWGAGGAAKLAEIERAEEAFETMLEESE